MSSPVKPFLFLHIPKTGGVTFHGVIAGQYRFARRFSFDPNRSEKWYDLGEDEKKNYDVVKGHFTFSEDFYPGKATYFTFLRNPEERIISHYFHIRAKPVHRMYDLVKENDFSLKELLKNGKVFEFDNLMVRKLSGNNKKAWGEINEEDLKLAIQNFDKHFGHFGLLEKYDESMVIMTYELGWKDPFYVHLNEGKGKKPKNDFDEETLKLISHFARFDKILWEHAKKKFDLKLEKYKATIDKDVETFRKNNLKGMKFREWYYKFFGQLALR